MLRIITECSFRLIEKNQKIKDDPNAPRVRPGLHSPLCNLITNGKVPWGESYLCRLLYLDIPKLSEHERTKRSRATRSLLMALIIFFMVCANLLRFPRVCPAGAVKK